VLSAFLLTLQLSNRSREELLQAKTWLTYALRRFLRIFPPYAAVLFALLLMGKMDAGELGSHLLLREGERQFWTIPVEVKYYLLLPFIALALFVAGRRHWSLGVLAGVGVGGIALALFGLEALWSRREEVLLAPMCAPFLLGSALALSYRALQQREPATQRRLAIWLEAGAVLAAILLMVRVPAIHAVLFQEKPLLGKEWDPAWCGLLWTVLLMGVLHGAGLLACVLEWRPLRFLGLISFSVYLWHVKFLSDVDDVPLPSPLRLLVYLALVIAVGTVSHFLLERPFSRIRWLRRRKELPASVSAS
jgi:peptidoglycan/LPS O-acetylase OafA/YrhL